MALKLRKAGKINLQIDFKPEAARPKEKISVKLEVEGASYSKAFRRKDALKWTIEGLFFAPTADIHVTIKENHVLHKKKELVNVTVKSAEITEGSRLITIKANDAVELKLSFDVPLELVKAAELRMEDAKRKLESKTVVLECLGKARGFADFVLGFGDLVAVIYPPAGAAIKAIDFLYEKLKVQEECNELAKEVLEALTSFLPFTNVITPDLMKLDNTKQAVKDMLELYKKAADLIIKYSSQNVLGEMIASKKGEIEDIQTDFKNARKAFDWCTKLETWKTALAAERLGEETLLRQLEPADKAYFNPDNVCLEGTRVPVLTDIIDWTGSGDGRVYWMYGLAGSGKSAIANTIAKELDSKSYLSGCFFCKRDIPGLRKPEALIPTLAYHLTRWHAPFRKAMLSVLQGVDRAKLDAKNLQWQFDLLIKEPLEQLKVDNPSDVPPNPLLFIVDALDECGDEPEPRTRLARLLAQMTALVPWLKVFITSRPNPEIQEGFQKANINVQPLDINSISAQSDIEHYTRTWIVKLPRLNPVWYTDERIGELSDKASGLFIWASTVQKFVSNPKRRDKNRALERIFSTQSADSPEAGLDALYKNVIEQIEGDSEDLEYIKAILGTITSVAKHRPLSVSALAVFLPQILDGQIISEDVLGDTIADLRAVLFEDPAHNGAVRVLHPSFLDFMGQKSRSAQYWSDPVQLDQHMAVKSLDVMKTELRFNICGLETAFMANSAVDNLPSIIKSKISEPLQYSSVHWADHLSGAENKVMAEYFIIDQVYGLLCTLQALYWLEVLSYTQQLQSSTNTLRIVFRLFKGRDEIITASTDLSRLVAAFYEAMSTSAPHIYTSAMSWVPEQSYLAKKLYPLLKNQPFAISGKDQHWPVSLWTAMTGGRVWKGAFSPDGERVVVGADDGSVTIFDARTGALVGDPLTGHSHEVKSVMYSPNGRHIISGSFDTTVIIWDVKTGESVGRLVGHTGPVQAAAYSPDGKYIASGSNDESIIIWDAKTQEPIGDPHMGHSDYVRRIIFSPDGSHFASASFDNTICIWKFKDGEVVGEPTKLIGHAGWCRGMAFFPDGKRLVSCSENIRIWDIETGQMIGDPMTGGHHHGMLSLALSPDGSRLVTGSLDNVLCFWDVKTRKRIGQPLEGHSSTVQDLVYSPDGMTVLSTSSDKSARMWSARVSEAEDNVPARGHELCVYDVAFSQDGERLMSCSSDSTFRVWNAATGASISVFPVDCKDGLRALCYSPDGKKVALALADGTVRIWDVDGGVFDCSLKGHTAAIRTVAYSKDGKLLASASVDSTVRIWDMETNTCQKELLGHSSYVNAVTFSLDGKRIISGSSDNSIRIWDVDTAEVIKEINPGVDEVKTISCSPDGSRLAFGSMDGTVAILHLDTEDDEITHTEGHSLEATAVCFSPDGKRIASASGDKSIQIWNAEDGSAIGGPLTGHTSSVFAVAFSPDGKHIASGSPDWTIRIWSAEAEARRHIDKIDMEVPLPINGEGWVLSPAGEHLLWVPQAYRNGISDLCDICIPPYAIGRPVRLDWSKFIGDGASWTGITSTSKL